MQALFYDFMKKLFNKAKIQCLGDFLRSNTGYKHADSVQRSNTGYKHADSVQRSKTTKKEALNSTPFSVYMY